MKNNIFNMLAPRNDVYFEYLSEMADAVAVTAGLMQQCFDPKTYEELHEYALRMKEMKLKGARLQTKITEELHKTFIAPFDREDISSLAKNIKDTIDHICSAAKRIVLYAPKNMPDASRELAGTVKDGADTIKQAVDLLDRLKKSPEQISELCKKLEILEDKADVIYENFLVGLFKNEKDPVEIIKLKDILYELEHATDSAEQVAKAIGMIVVKYA